MHKKQYLNLKKLIALRGYDKEITWSQNLRPCTDSWNFFREFMWVVLNSGMKNQVAEKIHYRIWEALADGKPISSAFNHKGKVDAINTVMESHELYFNSYSLAVDKIEYLKTLPYIGDITKYHLAKNLGHDCCKPDRHLERIALSYNLTPKTLCMKLAKATGDRIATVDLVIWRSANLGLI